MTSGRNILSSKKGWAFLGTGAPPPFWPFMVVVPVGMSFRCEYITMSSLYIYITTYIMRLGVYWKQDLLSSWAKMVLTCCRLLLLMVVPCSLLSSDTHTRTHTSSELPDFFTMWTISLLCPQLHRCLLGVILHLALQFHFRN